MTSTLHWLRNTTISEWLPKYGHLLGNKDALFISGIQSFKLPEQKPITQFIYGRKQAADSLDTAVPGYVVLKSDEEWVELVLSFEQQITW
ncbi:MAG: hypothetical protein LC639_06750 [Idiomarina sp.]|nr:hypothetical protein [Idiomarina sp.]